MSLTSNNTPLAIQLGRKLGRQHYSHIPHIYVNKTNLSTHITQEKSTNTTVLYIWPTKQQKNQYKSAKQPKYNCFSTNSASSAPVTTSLFPICTSSSSGKPSSSFLESFASPAPPILVPALPFLPCTTLCLV